VAGAFGVQGEIKVDVLTDFPERFDPGSRLFLNGAHVTVAAARSSGVNRLVIRLSEIGDRSEATALRGSTLDIHEDALTPLPDGAHYRFQLEGLTAVTDDGTLLGRVEEVIETGGTDVFVIRLEGREALVPNAEGITEVDIPNGRLVVHPIPGLLDGLAERPTDKR
jgi:16S rRNA processing protein RimM